MVGRGQPDYREGREAKARPLGHAAKVRAWVASFVYFCLAVLRLVVA